jgi:hypothetical protein
MSAALARRFMPMRAPITARWLPMSAALARRCMPMSAPITARWMPMSASLRIAGAR